MFRSIPELSIKLMKSFLRNKYHQPHFMKIRTKIRYQALNVIEQNYNNKSWFCLANEAALCYIPRRHLQCIKRIQWKMYTNLKVL